MDRRPSHSLASKPHAGWLTSALVLALSSQGLAQAAPQPIPAEVIRAPEFNADQLKQIKAYTSYWTDRLVQCQDPDDVQRARNELIRPLQQVNVNVSNVFRFEYSKSTVPQLEQAIAADNGKSVHCATNAITVISMLGTERALRSLLDHCEGQVQPSVQIRLRAAAGCATVLSARSLEVRPAMDAARRLRDMSKGEQSNLVLLRQFEAMHAADQGRFQESDRRQIRAYFVEAICTAIDDRIAGKELNDDSPVNAVNAAVILIRDKMLESGVIQPDEARELSLKLAPRLGKLLDFARANWQAAQADESNKRLLAATVATCEGFLPHLLRWAKAPPPTPSTGLRAAWSQADKARFEADVAVWLNTLSQAPFPKP